MGLRDNISVYAEHIPFCKVTHTQKKEKPNPKMTLLPCTFKLRAFFSKHSLKVQF